MLVVLGISILIAPACAVALIELPIDYDTSASTLLSANDSTHTSDQGLEVTTHTDIKCDCDGNYATAGTVVMTNTNTANEIVVNEISLTGDSSYGTSDYGTYTLTSTDTTPLTFSGTINNCSYSTSFNMSPSESKTFNISYTGGTTAGIQALYADTKTNGYFASVSVDHAKIEAYACLSSDKTSFTFYYDTEKATRTAAGCSCFNLNTGSNAPDWTSSITSATKTISFDSSFANYKPTTCFKWFYHFYFVTSIDLTNLDTSECTNMQQMFDTCSNSATGGPSTIDVSGLDTSACTNMLGMFAYTLTWTTLDLSAFDTSNVTTMYRMFWNCSTLVSVDVSNFDVTKLTNTYQMFYACTALTTIYCNDNWSTSSTLTTSTDMFTGSTKLPNYTTSYLDKSYAYPDNGSTGYFTAPSREAYAVYDSGELSFHYDASKSSRSGTVYDIPTSASSTSDVPWYSNAANITSITIDYGFKRYNGYTSTANWFADCNNSSLTSINCKNMDTSNVTNMSSMFGGCSSLTTLDLSSFNTSKTTTMAYMFNKCSKLATLNITNFDTSSVNYMYGMFQTCPSLTTLDLTSFNTSQVLSMSYMFNGCTALKTLNLGSSFTTSNVVNIDNMFNACNSLTSLDTTGFVTSKAISTACMFQGCSSLTALDLSSFDTSNVTDMTYMFNGCSTLTTLDLSTFDTSKVTTLFGMCQFCSNLTTINLTSFSISKLENTGYMFCQCYNLATIYCNSDWASSSTLTSSSIMFDNCVKLPHYNSSYVDKTYAYPDNGTTGYFTTKS